MYSLHGELRTRSLWGQYASCEPAYLTLTASIKENGLTICGPIQEIFPNYPRAVSPEEIIKDIYMPVR